MEWLQRMNEVLDYIEDNLTDDISLHQVAKKAGCSVFNFQRMFSFITDVPLAEYIRRRKLTLAALELQNSEIKVIDLAYKYGYGSPDSFSRAFQKLHGVTPSIARNVNVPLKAFPRLSFHISIRGDAEMNYKIVEKEAFTIFGKSITIGLDDDPYEVIPKFWEDFQNDGTYQKICKTAGFEPYSGKLLNAAVYDFTNDGSYKQKYMINTDHHSGIIVPDDLDVLAVPALKWVVFSAGINNKEETPKVIHQLWKRIFTEWFPTSSFEIAEGPQLEVFPEDLKTVEIWIPIK